MLKKEFAAPARDYLKKRGISAEIAKRWKIGFAPDEWDAFGNWARGRGYERNQILQSGLVKLRDEDRRDGEVYDRQYFHPDEMKNLQAREWYPVSPLESSLSDRAAWGARSQVRHARSMQLREVSRL